jgi:hypothetical protein
MIIIHFLDDFAQAFIHSCASSAALSTPAASPVLGFTAAAAAGTDFQASIHF